MQEFPTFPGIPWQHTQLYSNPRMAQTRNIPKAALPSQLPSPLPAKAGTEGQGSAQLSLLLGNLHIHLPIPETEVCVSPTPTAPSGNGQIQTGSRHSFPASLNSWRLNQPRTPNPTDPLTEELKRGFVSPPTIPTDTRHNFGGLRDSTPPQANPNRLHLLQEEEFQ